MDHSCSTDFRNTTANKIRLKRNLILIFVLLLIVSCKRDLVKDGLLMAEREATIGFNHLRIFKDSTFEFEYTSFPVSKIHTGTIEFRKDTIHFNYKDSIPAFGDKAIIDGRYLVYTHGTYNEKLEIWLDSITQ